MRSAFEEASVSEEAIEALEVSMDSDPGDRYVLAAVAGGAEAIITSQHVPAGSGETQREASHGDQAADAVG